MVIMTTFNAIWHVLWEHKVSITVIESSIETEKVIWCNNYLTQLWMLLDKFASAAVKASLNCLMIII